MWGNDLSKTASKKDENKLIDLLQKQFARANGEGVGGAAADAFNEYLEYFEAKSFSVDGGRAMDSAFMLIFGLPFLGAGLLVIIFAHKKYQEAKKEGIKTYRINGEPRLYILCGYRRALPALRSAIKGFIRKSIIDAKKCLHFLKPYDIVDA